MADYFVLNLPEDGPDGEVDQRNEENRNEGCHLVRTHHEYSYDQNNDVLVYA